MKKKYRVYVQVYVETWADNEAKACESVTGDLHQRRLHDPEVISCQEIEPEPYEMSPNGETFQPELKVGGLYKVWGYDTYDSSWYSFTDGPPGYKTHTEACADANKYLNEIKKNQAGAGPIQDKIFIEDPQGNRHPFHGI